MRMRLILVVVGSLASWWAVPAQAAQDTSLCVQSKGNFGLNCVPVDGTNPLPVTTAGGTTTTNDAASITTGNTFQVLIAANPNRKSFVIENNNTAAHNCWVFVGSAAATEATAILLVPGGSYIRGNGTIPTDQIQGTCTNNGDTMYADEQ